MNAHFDVIIVGLGANGSAAAFHLARSGHRVCGIDRYTPPHTHGSSHGQSRIIRTVYYEHPLYVPLVQRAWEYWEDIEKSTGAHLLMRTGALMLGRENSALIRGSLTSAAQHGLAYEFLNASAIRRRCPAMKVEEDIVATLEKQAGILFPETCIQNMLAEAAYNGASLHYNQQVREIIPRDDSVRVETESGTYSADAVILSAGAWMNSLLPDLQLPLTIERQVLFWFRDRNASTASSLSPGQLPVFIREHEEGRMFYGFPDLGDGMKIASYQGDSQIEPDDLRNDTTEEEIAAMQELTGRYFNMDPVLNYAATCMYTNTPDNHFIIDRHPAHSNIIIGSPCSGHGFKFASLTGKLLAQLATDEKPEFDLSPFSIGRFHL